MWLGQSQVNYTIEGVRHTFVTGVPAISFSKKIGIAIGPKAGVAARHFLWDHGS